MIQNEALDMIIEALLKRNLGEAITATDNFLAVVCATCTTDATVFTPHVSVLYNGTDATIALP